MSVFGNYAPLADACTPPPNLSPGLLLREFRKFAYNNAAFKAGLIDGIYLKMIEGDELEPDNVPTDEVSVGYIFSADRVRNSNRPYRPEVAYQMSVLVVRDIIEIPAHIAMQYYDCDDPKLAVDQAGNGALEHEKRFTITNLGRSLLVCDSYTYKDDEGDILSYACTCPDKEPVAPPYILSGRDDDEILYSSPHSISGSSVDHEAITLEDADTVAELWAGMAEFESGFGYAETTRQKEQDLQEAYISFALFKAGLRRQLGL
jgi:hypothetical protein